MKPERKQDTWGRFWVTWWMVLPFSNKKFKAINENAHCLSLFICVCIERSRKRYQFYVLLSIEIRFISFCSLTKELEFMFLLSIFFANSFLFYCYSSSLSTAFTAFNLFIGSQFFLCVFVWVTWPLNE